MADHSSLVVCPSGNVLVIINKVALRRARLVPLRVTVLARRVNHLCAEPATHVYSAWPSLCG